MRFDQQAIRDSQRKAYAALTGHGVVHHDVSGKGEKRKVDKVVKMNEHYVPPKLTSSPGMLVQELPWVNTGQNFVFDFSQNAPPQVPGVNNNVLLAKNDIFAIYGFQILFGTGTDSADFIYRSHGVLPADDTLFNSVIKLKIESSTYIDKMAGQFFRDNPGNSNEYYGEIGLQLINPIRIVSGELGVFEASINILNPFANLVISANTVVSFRLHGVYGQAIG